MQQYSRQSKIAENTSVREPSLDVLRGIAVVLMIIAHAVVFFHDRTDSILNFLTSAGDTLAFTIFLFVSGAVAFFTITSQSGTPFERREKQLRRVFGLLIGYYFLAFIISYPTFHHSFSPHLIRDIYEILFFVNVPVYTEFMIPFIFFGFIQAFFPQLLAKIGKNLWLVILVGVVAYIIGYLLYPAFAPDTILYIKAILVGHPELYRFPILFYLPVFLVGLFWGSIIKSSKESDERQSISSFFAIAFIIIYIYIAIVSPVAQFGYLDDPWGRWPPNIGFLTIGLMFSFIFLFLYSLKKKESTNFFVEKVLEFFGKVAFSLYVIHILILIAYRAIFDTVYQNPLIVYGLIILTFALSLLFTVFNLYVNLFLKRLFKKDELHIIELIWKPFVRPNDTRVIKKRYFIVAAILLLALSSNVGVREEFEFPTITANDITWWNYEFSSFKQITIRNNNAFASINKDDEVFFRIDHRDLVESKKSLPTGEDFHVVFYDSASKKYTDIPIIIKSPNNSETEIVFTIQKNIWAQEFDPNYFFYFGNDFATSHTAETRNESELTRPKSFQVIIGPEEQPDLTIATSKLWVLRDDLQDQNRNLIITATSNTEELDRFSNVSYEIEKTQFKGKMTFLTTGGISKKSQWSASLDVKSLPVGTYKVNVVAKDSEGGITFRSPTRGFFVSEPLYLAWTMDWEGMNVEDRFLGVMSKMSSSHDDLPITHFFNPRIFVTAENGSGLSSEDVITPDRAEYLKEWVLDRRDRSGDQIAMHLHMQYDFVEAAGIAPKTGPTWDNNPTGYSVASSTYSKDEFQQIVGYGLEVFNKEGIPKPTVFRVAGWQADQEVLAALNDLQFIADSSAREAAILGALPIPWNVSSTSGPYQISRINQNSSSSNPSENYSLWELPNNGGNSATFDDQQMIAIFNQNYQINQPLDKKKLIVSLSHPHWFETPEELKIDKYLSYTDQYLYSQDRGPVIYITLDEAMEGFGIL